MRANRVFGSGSTKKRASYRLWREDAGLFLDFRRGIDVFVERAGTGADGGGEDLFEALGGGYGFDGFEVLFLISSGLTQD